MPLLFINFSPPAPPLPRFFNHLFNLAHIPLFTLITFTCWQTLSRRFQPLRTTLLFCLTLTLFLGIVIELAQSYSGRSASLSDLRLNLLGLTLFLAIGPGDLPYPSRARRLFGLTATIWLLIECRPLYLSVVDYRSLQDQPTLLSDFETHGQASRWSQGKRVLLNRDPGGFALRVPLSTDTYTGSTLEYFNRNWSPYKSLQLDIYNGDQQPQQIQIKIRDSQAVIDGDLGSMRFDSQRLLKPGWNTFSIPIQKIAQAPQTRRMDLESIHALTLFQMNRTTPGFMLIDNVRLRED